MYAVSFKWPTFKASRTTAVHLNTLTHAYRLSVLKLFAKPPQQAYILELRFGIPFYKHIGGTIFKFRNILFYFFEILFSIWFAIHKVQENLFLVLLMWRHKFFIRIFSQNLCVLEVWFFRHFSCTLSENSLSENSCSDIWITCIYFLHFCILFLLF